MSSRGISKRIISGAVVLLFAAVPDHANAWRTEVDGTTADVFDPTQPNDIAYSVAVGASGDVFAAGRLNNLSTGFDFVVMKFSKTTGSEIWRREINGTDGGFEYALSLAVDPFGDVIAAGRTHNTATHYDFAVIKFSGATGAELWRKEINGTAGTYEYAAAVTTDASGNVIAVGRTNNAVSGYDFAVIKFARLDGAELWRKEINGAYGGF